MADKNLAFTKGTYFKLKFKDVNDVVENVESFSKVSGLELSIDSEEVTAPGANVTKTVPGKLNYDQITLVRPLMRKGSNEDVDYVGNKNYLYNWIQNVNNFLVSKEVDDLDYRREVILEIYCNLNEDPIREIIIKNAWPESFGISDLDASSDQVLVETLVLNHEGWTFRD
jgi:phage tail-like protein